MTTASPLAPAPLPTWVLVLIATCAAWVLRAWGGYPLEPSDEHNWAQIALAVQQGTAWPISGPLHFEATQVLARALGLSPASALAVLGVLSVPAVLGVYVLAYRWLGFAQAAWPLLALGLSTYFWAPLLESRPQQWGQAFTLLCVAGAWRVLSGQNLSDRLPASHSPAHNAPPDSKAAWFGRYLAGSLLFAGLAWIHILSTAVSFCLCLVLAFFMLATGQTRWQRVMWLGACSLPGLLVLAWPNGPYQMMWLDIRHSLLRVAEGHLLVAAVGLVVLATVTMVLIRRHGKTMLSAALARFDAHPHIGVGILMALASVALGLQASLLPDQAWHHYNGYALLFGLFQLGNVFFLWLLLRGLQMARQAQLVAPIPQWAGLATLLACAALVGGGLLLVSFFLRDTNWFLRFVNYALPLTAPFVALALGQLTDSKAASYACWLLGALSLSVAARPSILFNEGRPAKPRQPLPDVRQ